MNTRSKVKGQRSKVRRSTVFAFCILHLAFLSTACGERANGEAAPAAPVAVQIGRKTS